MHLSKVQSFEGFFRGFPQLKSNANLGKTQEMRNSRQLNGTICDWCLSFLLPKNEKQSDCQLLLILTSRKYIYIYWFLMLFLWYFRVETNWQFVEWKMAMASIIPIISLYPPGKLVPRRVYHIFGNLWSRLFLRSLAFSHSKNLMPFLSTKKIWKDVHMCLRCLYIATCGYLCISISTVCKYRYIYRNICNHNDIKKYVNTMNTIMYGV